MMRFRLLLVAALAAALLILTVSSPRRAALRQPDRPDAPPLPAPSASASAAPKRPIASGKFSGLARLETGRPGVRETRTVAPATARPRLAAAMRGVHMPGPGRARALAVYRSRLAAAAAAARRNPQPYRVLLSDPDPGRRMEGIVVLSEIRDAMALAESLPREPDKGLKLAILHGLATSGGDVARQAIERQYRQWNGDPHRYHALRALGLLGSRAALNTLVDALLHDPDAAVRAHAAEAVASTGSGRARRELEAAAATETHPAVSMALRRALARLGAS